MNDKINLPNKIISSNVLIEIFEKMDEVYNKWMKVAKIEKEKNLVIDYNYQEYTFNNLASSYDFTIEYYDNTSLKYNTYASFIGAYNNRIDEIKSINVHFYLGYETKNEHGERKDYSESIYISLYENDASIDFKMSEENSKIRDIYDFIKLIINDCPPKYGKIISNRVFITNAIGFTIGFIPAIIIMILLLLVPEVKNLVIGSFVLFPIGTLLISFMLIPICSSHISGLYEPLKPQKEYVKYSAEYGSIYRDDIEGFKKKTEVLIGRNINNLSNRKKIENSYNKVKKFIPCELIILIIVSIIISML